MNIPHQLKNCFIVFWLTGFNPSGIMNLKASDYGIADLIDDIFQSTGSRKGGRYSHEKSGNPDLFFPPVFLQYPIKRYSIRRR